MRKLNTAIYQEFITEYGDTNYPTKFGEPCIKKGTMQELCSRTRAKHLTLEMAASVKIQTHSVIISSLSACCRTCGTWIAEQLNSTTRAPLSLKFNSSFVALILELLGLTVKCSMPRISHFSSVASSLNSMRAFMSKIWASKGRAWVGEE